MFYALFYVNAELRVLRIPAKSESDAELRFCNYSQQSGLADAELFLVSRYPSYGN